MDAGAERRPKRRRARRQNRRVPVEGQRIASSSASNKGRHVNVTARARALNLSRDRWPRRTQRPRLAIPGAQARTVPLSRREARLPRPFPRSDGTAPTMMARSSARPWPSVSHEEERDAGCRRPRPVTAGRVAGMSATGQYRERRSPRATRRSSIRHKRVARGEKFANVVFEQPISIRALGSSRVVEVDPVITSHDHDTAAAAERPVNTCDRGVEPTDQR